MNKVMLIGNLTRDPELRTTSSGTSVCTFSIAVNRNFTNAAGEREADFINITVWRGLAENCAKYLTKGRKVAVAGSLQSRTYDDKEGNKRYALEVVADDVEFLSSRNDSADAPAAGANRPAARKPIANLQPVDDELPF